MVSGDPTAAIAGVNPEMVGSPELAVTVKGLAFADPAGVVTPIAPEPGTAPAGTLVTMLVAVLEATVADKPLTVTVFSEGVALKPVP